MAEARKVMLMSSDGEGALCMVFVWSWALWALETCVWVFSVEGVRVHGAYFSSLWLFCALVVLYGVCFLCTLRSHRVKFVGCSEGVQRVGFLWLVSFRLGLSHTHTLTHF